MQRCPVACPIRLRALGYCLREESPAGMEDIDIFGNDTMVLVPVSLG